MVYNKEITSTFLANKYKYQYFNLDKIEKYPKEVIAAIKKVDKHQFDETFRSVFSHDSWYLGLIGEKRWKI